MVVLCWAGAGTKTHDDEEAEMKKETMKKKTNDGNLGHYTNMVRCVCARFFSLCSVLCCAVPCSMERR